MGVETTHQEVRERLKEIIGERAEQTWINSYNERPRFGVEFVPDAEVCCNQTLENLREAGFSVYAFGTNLEDSDNITASFEHADF